MPEKKLLAISDETIKRIERRHFTHFWGRRRRVTAVFIRQHLGNGGKLISITPANTRPNYYVIRVDSRWKCSNYDSEPTIGTHLEEILEAIEDQCGTSFEDRYESPTGRERHNPWPALSADSGVSWADASDLLPKKRSKP